MQLKILYEDVSGYPIEDPILQNIVQALGEQLPQLSVTNKQDGTLFISEVGRGRSLTVRRSPERGFEEDGQITVRAATGDTIHSSKDGYQALGAIVDHFTAVRQAR